MTQQRYWIAEILNDREVLTTEEQAERLRQLGATVFEVYTQQQIPDLVFRKLLEELKS
jgi:hypothetical protein